MLCFVSGEASIWIPYASCILDNFNIVEVGLEMESSYGIDELSKSSGSHAAHEFTQVMTTVPTDGNVSNHDIKYS